MHLGTQTKLRILAHHVLKAAQRIFGIPDLRHYALADGFAEILHRSGKAPRSGPLIETSDAQLLLFQ